MSDQVQNEAGQWVPAIPEPLWVWRWFSWRPSCCGIRFPDMDGYRAHWLDEHVGDDR